MNKSAATLAIDLGGTRIKAGVVVEHTVVCQRIVPTEDERGFDRVLHNIMTVSEDLMRERAVGGVGLSLPAIVDVDKGMVVDVRKNLEGLIGFPLADTMSHRFGLPVVLENDARLYGLGELVAGAAQGIGNMVCLTFGTGVGCCVAINGHILRGRHGTGGILGGHMTIETYGPPCTCGNIGCFEALCRAASLVNETHERLTAYPGHVLQGIDKLTPEAIIAAADAGDTLAQDALAAYVRHIAAGVVSYIHVYDPDIVVLGGGVMNAAKHLLPPVQEFVRAHAWTIPSQRVPVRAAVLGDQAALVGAAALACGEGQFY